MKFFQYYICMIEVLTRPGNTEPITGCFEDEIGFIEKARRAVLAEIYPRGLNPVYPSAGYICGRLDYLERLERKLVLQTVTADRCPTEAEARLTQANKTAEKTRLEIARLAHNESAAG